MLQKFEILPLHLYYLPLLTTIYILRHTAEWYNRGVFGKLYIRTESSEMVGIDVVDKDCIFGKIIE